MAKAKQILKQADLIADAIVELVERVDGPVTLAQIDREIANFRTTKPPSWEYVVQHNSGEALIWTGMTKAGLIALRKVMSGRRLAVQALISVVPYLLQGRCPECDSWLPVALLPLRTANLDTPNWRMRASQGFRGHCMREAAARGVQGYRLLTPRAVHVRGDEFAV